MEKFFILPKPDLSVTDIGVKAFHLNRLIRSGYRVPHCLFVPVQVYFDFLSHNHLDALTDEVNTLLKRGVEEAALHPHLEKLRTGIRKGVPPEGFREEFERLSPSLRGSPEEKLAIRSSGIQEDLAGHSFAGQLHTVLNVDNSFRAVFAAVKEVWASLWEWNYLRYLFGSGVTVSKAGMGVIVQKMLRPEFAGVLFSRSPISAHPNTMLVEFVQGTADSLVSGRETPRQLLIDKSSGAILQGEQTLTTDPGKETITGLIELGKNLEETLRSAVDVEWAVEKNQLYVLQVRPITTSTEAAGDEILWTDENVEEVIPDVVTPFSWSMLEPITNNAFRFFLSRIGVKQFLTEELFTLYQGKVYFNHTAFVKTLSMFYPGERIRQMPVRGGKVATVGAYLLLGLQSVFQGLQIAAFTIRLPGEIQKMLSRFESRIAPHRYRQAVSPKEHLACMEGIWQLQKRLMALHLSGTMFGEIFYQFLNKLCRKWFPAMTNITAESLLQGIAGAESARSGRELWKLAKVISRHPQTAILFENDADTIAAAMEHLPADSEVHQAMEHFFAEFGHCALHEFEFLYPRWEEDRRYVYESLKSYLDNLSQFNLPMETERLTERREQLRRQAVEYLSGWRYLFRRKLFTFVLKRTTLFNLQRENLKQQLVKAHFEIKKHLLGISRQFVKSGKLSEETDIFYLTYPEIRKLVMDSSLPMDIHNTIRLRREERERFLQQVHPRKIRQVGEQWLPLPDEDGGAGEQLSGIGCSDGIAQGRVRVIRSDEETGTLQKGEILVTRFTNPGWTPVLVMAGGIITEIGGALSHGAIIAREYGIPMVTAVTGITERLKTGDRVRLNGALGIVEILNEEEESADAPSANASQ